MTAGVDIDFNAVDDEASEAELEQEGQEMAQLEEFNEDLQLQAHGRVRTRQQFEADILQQFGEEATAGIQVV